MLVALVAVCAGAAPAWVDAPAFSLAPAELLALAAESQPEQTLVAELLQHHSVRYDGAGRQEWTFRRVYQVRHPAAVTAWSNVQAPWTPWFQEPPDITARVITPDAAVHPLDTSTITEDPATPPTPGTRRLSAPLPALTPGAVVEEQVIWRDDRDFLEAGRLGWWPLAAPWPIDHLVHEVRAPAGVPFDFAIRGAIPESPRRIRERGIVGVRLEQTDVPPMAEPEPFGPIGWEPWATLEVSTARSWSQVGRAYEAQLARTHAPDGLADWVAELTVLEDRDARIDAAARMVRDRIRYVEVPFGEQALVPAAPATVRERGTADGKDMSALIVALLRGVGIDAHLALVRSTPGLDVHALPGLDAFDHAIVFVSGVRGAADRWFDPTVPFLPVRETPIDLQGRHALAIDGGRSRLRTIPRSSPDDNTLVERRRWVLPWDGIATVHQDVEATGLPAALLRTPLWEEAGEIGAILGGHYAHILHGTAGPVTAQGVSDPDVPTRIAVTIADVPLGETTGSDGSIKLDVEDLAILFPAATAATADRTRPLVVPPHRITIIDTLELTPGYRPHQLPADETWAIGDVRASVGTTVADDRIVVTHTLEAGGGPVAPDELPDLRRELTAWSERYVPIGLVHGADLATHGGDLLAAFAETQRLLAAHPNHPHLVAQRAGLLLEAGFTDAAAVDAQKAVTLAPDAPLPWRYLGFVRTYGPWGRRFGRGWDRAGSISALEQALQRAPDDASAAVHLAQALLAPAQRWAVPDERDLDRAVDILAVLRTEFGWTEQVDAELDALLALGRPDAALDVLDSVASTPRREAARIAALALAGGPEAAIAAARRTADPAAILLAAGERLTFVRAYPERRALLQAADPDGSGRHRLDATYRREDRARDASDPAEVAWRGIVGILDRATRDDAIPVDPALLRAPGIDAAAAAFVPGVFAGAEGPAVLDLTLAYGIGFAEVDAAPGGWRVRNGTLAAYVAQTPDGPRLRALHSTPAQLAEHALVLDDAGDPAAATWAEWALEAVDRAALALLDPTDRTHRRWIIGAVLAPSHPERGCPLIPSHGEGLALAVRVRAVASCAGGPALLDRAHEVPRARITELWRADRRDEAMALLREAQEASPADPGLANDLAWRLLFTDTDPSEAVTFARTSVRLQPTPARRHTLATALAVSGDVSGAHRVLREALAAHGELPDDWHLVLALIAARLGEAALARTHLDDVPDQDGVFSSHALAARIRETLP